MRACTRQVIRCHASFLAHALDGLLLCRLHLLRPLLALQQGALDFAARINVAWDALDERLVGGQGWREPRPCAVIVRLPHPSLLTAFQLCSPDRPLPVPHSRAAAGSGSDGGRRPSGSASRAGAAGQGQQLRGCTR